MIKNVKEDSLFLEKLTVLEIVECLEKLFAAQIWSCCKCDSKLINLKTIHKTFAEAYIIKN